MMDSSVNYHRRNEKSGRKWITVAIWSGVIFAVLAYSLHVPLPHSLGDRHVLQVIELVLRVVYFYPMRFLAFMGAEWQLIWTRLSMVTLAKVVTNPWTSYDRDLNVSFSRKNFETVDLFLSINIFISLSVSIFTKHTAFIFSYSFISVLLVISNRFIVTNVIGELNH